MIVNPYVRADDAYEPLFTNLYLPDEEYEIFNLSMPDERLEKMLVNSLDEDLAYWNKSPWNLEQTDKENVNYFLGNMSQDGKFVINQNQQYADNRLFTATRAILSYVTGQLAQPDIVPSRSDEEYVKMARAVQTALYQHSLDEKVDQKTRAAVLNLITRKRGYMKIRFDPNLGMYGDLITEVCNPEDIIIDRHAKFMSNPNVVYHRIRCTLDELCAKFPQKKAEILRIFNIKQGRYTQMSRFVTYFEAWFTYIDTNNKPKEAVAWFLHDPAPLILDKIPNPNWIYTGDDDRDKQVNLTSSPPKPFTWFNYLNFGNSFIDETTLFDQAKIQQVMLNQRGQQLSDNIDYQNGRWIASKKALNEEDGQKIINKGARTIALVDSDDVNKAFANIGANALPGQVYESIVDYRNEIDTMMGTPSIFRGAQPERTDTLGRDIMVKQQAGMLQDDLVRAIQLGMEEYYKIKLQMMRVYFTDDYWFQTKGPDGKYNFIMLNGDLIDPNVKIGVQVDSTLPLDKAMERQQALDDAKLGMIDPLSYFEATGQPNPEIRADRLSRYRLDPVAYMQSVEQSMDNSDAEMDILLLTYGKEPDERDEYDADYINYYNHFITTNRFQKLPPDAQQRITGFLMVVQHLAEQSAQLQEPLANKAGMIELPPAPAAPKRTENINIKGEIDPETSQQIAVPNQAAGV